MVEPIKNWVKENSTLVGFLVAQLLAIGALGASGFAYMIKLETRVSIMETRGAEYSVARMGKMEERITVIEQVGNRHTAQLERIVDLLTKK
jgi:hypothetical protein